jgi:FAD/FMN-containing dehydrogenase/Fe-S oxidoreductase
LNHHHGQLTRLKTSRIREIPYNYTSFSDREIVLRFLGEDMWEILDRLRDQRKTGRSARMLFDVLGDMWVISRNPFIQDDLLANPDRWSSLAGTLHERLDQITQRAGGNVDALNLADKGREAVLEFEKCLQNARSLRGKIKKRLSSVTAKDNIHFDGTMRVSHVTDASDWRVEYPLVILTPDCEREVRDMVEACIDLGLTIIPRGGGTGYTGGAIPLHSQTAVINTERLLRLDTVEQRTLPGVSAKVPTIGVEAGVVTRRVAERAYAADLVFAVDPTSQDASCIGGNIAMNAGGKKAVMWGTTLDNLVSWRMVTPDARWLEVERLDHNLGKIHHQDKARFSIQHFLADGTTPDGEPEILEIPGDQLRRSGLGKDVTNKFLGGLPGIQKEGCDGLITSGRFILHRMPEHIHTLCLEFFGTDLRLAVSSIVEIIDLVEKQDDILLSGLEHLDERYIKAVRYSTKAARADLPKMILLVDLGSDDESLLTDMAGQIIEKVSKNNAEGFVAVSPEARHRFWLDRSRTAAIAAHTNAFKINEDVVIPLDRLAEYSEGIERINITQSTQNKLAILAEVSRYIEQDMRADISFENFGDSDEEQAILQAKTEAAIEHLKQVRSCWSSILAEPDKPVSAFPVLRSQLTADTTDDTPTFNLLQERKLRISYRRDVEKPLKEIFSGKNLAQVCDTLDDIHARVRSSRIFVATHMHAGDGNVHTNIPVHSNDYQMLHEADRVVCQIMQLAESLGGVISGEHGIGLTKMQFMKPEAVEAFARYKKKVDPDDHFNRGKLMAGSGLERAYTPSLRLVQQEALILEASALGDLNDMIKDCLRCGKCKPVCTTHVPGANLLYSPRNKILSTGLIIEAFLYEEQTRRGISTRHFDEMNDIADHCTVCHRCLSPCPVDIDFGDVSAQMKTIMRDQNVRQFNPGTWAAMKFLNVTSPRSIKLMRTFMIQAGYLAQHWTSVLANRFRLLPERKRPTTSVGKPTVTSQIVNFIEKPLPSNVTGPTLRAMLSIEDANTVPVIRDAARVNDDSDTVFYFPGCGSERLFSQIGMATLSMLYRQGVRTILPPGYLCCGYPQAAAGDAKKSGDISTANQVLMHRISNTLGYLDISTVIVSCGTCLDQLLKYQLEKIFPRVRMLDIHEYLMESGVKLPASDTAYLYHDPCHTPMKKHDPINVSRTLLGAEVTLSDRCCGESGTFAVSRPDIATQVRYRKEQEIQENIRGLPSGNADAGETRILTSCPSCQQGLSRYEPATGLKTDYVVVELARRMLGEDWLERYSAEINERGIERVLL